ncbi:protein-L-isoaspartate(D-aspartate) O-methyltransferase [Kaarinaea lacus]
MTQSVKDRMENMIREIENEVAFTRRYIGKDKLDSRVMAAMKAVPRHEFVPSNQQLLAYINGPLSIGHGQTISQPYIVALMTDLMNVNKDSVVLEIGTGSGYQAAVLSTLVKQVYSMEVIPELMESARQKFEKLGYTNIECRLGDGHEGWPEHAPYDAIIVTAAAEEIPKALIEQLKPNANLVIPVGSTFGPQELLLVHKDQDGEITTRDVLAVAFVPLVRTGSWH